MLCDDFIVHKMNVVKKLNYFTISKFVNIRFLIYIILCLIKIYKMESIINAAFIKKERK